MNKYERNIFEMFKYYQREYEPGENQSNNKKEEAKMENSSSSRPSNEVQFALNAITREMSKSNANFYSETVGEIGDFLLRCSHTSYNEQYNKSFNSFLVYLENQNKLFDSLCSSLNYSSIATKFLQMPLRNDQMM